VKKAAIISILAAIALIAGNSFICTSAYGDSGDLYGVSLHNNNIYQINPTTGAVTVASSTSLFSSTSAASDDSYIYYWNTAVGGTQRGIAKWNPLTDTHTLISATDSSNPDVSEENAARDAAGNLWVLDRSDSIDPSASNGHRKDNTKNLYTIDKTTGTRTLQYTLPKTNNGTYDYSLGDIAWGPDGKLYISTNNISRGYDSKNNNYVWDPTNPSSLDKKDGSYYAGLAWIGNKLYGSRIDTGTTSAIFELNPADFSEIGGARATMPTGVSLGDLSTGAVPEPATIVLLGLGCLSLRRKFLKA
jgi:sugar lactone lactonase YvrE